MRDLNGLIPPDSGWELYDATAINDTGQITGIGLVNGEEHAFLLSPTDRDNDGLLDIDEPMYGTDPDKADTDGDELLDGTEVEMSMGSGCPNPTIYDSDGDSLSDGEEVEEGTNPCAADSDGDGIRDDVDPLPTKPGVTSGFLEDLVRATSADILRLDLSLFDAPNNNAGEGRRNALSNRASEAANAIATGDYQSAIESLTSLLEKIDADNPPPDWMEDSQEKSDLADEVSNQIYLLGFQ